MASVQIQAPDGSLVEFPEGTSDDTILQVMRQSFPQAGAPAPAAPAEPPSLASRAYRALADVPQSVASGMVKGAAGLAALPNAAIDLADRYVAGPAAAAVVRAVGGTPNSDRGIDTSGHIQDGFPTQERILKPVERLLHKPETVPGEYAQTLGEFAVGAPRRAAQFAALALAPAVASETAGQATKGTAAEPIARAVTGIGATVGGSLLAGSKLYERMAARAAHGATPEQMAQAEELARSAPFPIMASEAIQAASSGATQMGRMQRLAESTEGGARVLDPIMARRPAQMQTATDATLDMLGPRNPRPAELGREVQEAARGAVMASPEGTALSQAMEAAGPRTTAGMAGAAIQPDLRGTRDLREAARSSRAAVDYRLAREAPENVGVERMVTVERPGEPIITYPEGRPQFTDAAPRPLERPSFDRIKGEAGDESLARIVARNGGIDLNGDARAADLQRFSIPGLGAVARPGGKSIDGFWREFLIDRGYLKPDADGSAARDITNELLRLLQNEQRAGQAGARFPIHAERTAGRTASSQADEFQNAYQTWGGRLDEDLTRAGVDPSSVGPEVRSRVMGALMRGEEGDPLAAYERTVSAMREPPAPYVRSTTVEEQVPDVRFGQVNPQRAIDAIDELQRTAKGDVSGALAGVRRNLHGPDGQTDLTVAGNLRTRERLDQEISAAEAIGDGTKVRDLTIARNAIDAELKRVPEVARADANFARNSIPLEPFSGQNPLGRVTARDDLSGRMQMPAEQVPTALSTPSAAREFGQIAGPGARSAFDDYLTTRMLDAAPDAYRVNAEGLRGGMRDSADLLAEAPTVRDRLSRVLAAREGLAPVEATPVGRMAERESTREQLAQLLARDASPTETRETVLALRGQNEPAARGLVREGASQMADRTVHRPDSLGRPDQYGGARFAREYASPGEGANLRAAITATVGDGARGMDPLLDALRATGWRERVGSRTAFNTEDLKDMKQGGYIGALAKLGSGPMHTAREGVEKMLLGRSSEGLARLLASGPEGVRRIQELQRENSRAALIAALAASRADQEPAFPRR